MTAFAKSLGVEPNGQQLKALKDQLARLAASTVRMGIMEEGRAVQVNTQIVSAFDLWFPKQADQRVLWPSTVRLSEEYFQSLGRHAVPLDHRAVAALASSSMALDTYVWLAQRLHRVPPGKPQFIAWATAYEQFGQGFARVRDFRRQFLQTLAHVKSAYPSAHIAADEQGLTLEHSPPPVAPRFTAVTPGPKADHGKLVAPLAATQANGFPSESHDRGHAEARGNLLNNRSSPTVSWSRPAHRHGRPTAAWRGTKLTVATSPR